MFGRKIKQWFTLGRTVTLLIALVGLGLLVGGAVGTLPGGLADAAAGRLQRGLEPAAVLVQHQPLRTPFSSVNSIWVVASTA